MLRVHEIFTSIQGEGLDTGLPCTFIRLFGCNLKCVYCDQPQDPKDMKEMSIKEIIEEVQKSPVKNICLTGGEPLMQSKANELIETLVREGYNVSIETNGTIYIPRYEGRKHKYVMDVKTPSSYINQFSNKYDNLLRLTNIDEVKFVIGDRQDYMFMKDILRDFPTEATVLVSPMFDEKHKQHIGQDLCNWIIEDNLDVRVSLQVHKFLGVL